MAFSLDFNDVFEGTGVKDGSYEVFVSSVEEKATPGGAEYTELDLIIRNDIAGNEHKNAHIFHKIWKKKEDGKYNMKTFNTLGKAFGLTNGKQYTSFRNLLDDFIDRTAIATVKNEKSEYNGKEYNNLNVKYFNPSKFTQLAHVKKEKAEMTYDEMVSTGIDIQDSDLPF